MSLGSVVGRRHVFGGMVLGEAIPGGVEGA